MGTRAALRTRTGALLLPGTLFLAIVPLCFSQIFGLTWLVIGLFLESEKDEIITSNLQENHMVAVWDNKFTKGNEIYF